MRLASYSLCRSSRARCLSRYSWCLYAAHRQQTHTLGHVLDDPDRRDRRRHLLSRSASRSALRWRYSWWRRSRSIRRCSRSASMSWTGVEEKL
jgi:hypothetical protein